MSSKILPPPSWRALFRGAVREALAAAYSIAEFGIQETRAWEMPMRYIADDNQGNVGVIEFRLDGAIAAMSARAPARTLDRQQAIELAPPGLRDAISRICELPLLQEGLGVSELFWTERELIRGPESWDEICRHGAEIFERELQSDVEWMATGASYYDIDAAVARHVIEASRRAVVGIPILRLSREEVSMLIPKGSKHENAALSVLVSERLIEVS